MELRSVYMVATAPHRGRIVPGRVRDAVGEAGAQ
jgi:hypothetical protein